MILLLTWKYLKSSFSLPTGLCLQGPCHLLCINSPFSILPRLINSMTARSCFGYIETLKTLHASPADMRGTCSLLGDFCISQLLNMSIWQCNSPKIILFVLFLEWVLTKVRFSSRPSHANNRLYQHQSSSSDIHSWKWFEAKYSLRFLLTFGCFGYIFPRLFIFFF